jgi:hypothetical protein
LFFLRRWADDFYASALFRFSSYDHTAGYSSNSLSSYFHDIGWRDRLNNLVGSEWLSLNSCTLGGNYGEVTPTDLGFSLKASHADASTAACQVDKDPWPTTHDNTLSVLAVRQHFFTPSFLLPTLKVFSRLLT